MGLAEIDAKIIAEAEAEAAAIRAATAAEATKIRETTAAKAAVIRQKIEAAGTRQAKQAILAPARLLAKRQLLAEKQRLLGEVMDDLPAARREEKEIAVGKFLYG
jgi:vacuolar-type H+-ATPase subunit E/Vma4